MENEFIKYTISWCKGELFESRMILLVGLFCLVVTFSLWKFGTTPNAKILIVPALILGIVFTAIGIAGNQSNLNRIHELPKAFASDPEKFIQDEKIRTEGFMKFYPPIRYSMSGILVIAIILFLASTAPSIWKSIAITLMAGALTILIVDLFSEERADTYHTHIIKAVEI